MSYSRARGQGSAPPLVSGSAWEPAHQADDEADGWSRRRGGDAYDDAREAEDQEEQEGAGVQVALAAALAFARAAWSLLRTTPGASVAAGVTGFLWGRHAAGSEGRQAGRDRRDAAELAFLAEEHIRAAEARAKQCDARLRDERALQAAVVARLEAQVAALKSSLAEADVRAAVECKRLWDAKQAEVLALEKHIQALLEQEGLPAKHPATSFVQPAYRQEEDDEDTWIDEE